MNEPRKSALRARYEQFIYWSSIGWDVLHPGKTGSVYVLGYIKSGTNWLCHLLSSALSIPILEIWKINGPRYDHCIFHMHRFIPVEHVRRRTVYLMRDGRDTIVSAYFHVVREGGEIKTRLERRLGRPVTAENIRDNLPEFIRYMEENNIATVDYRAHLKQWQRHRDQYVTARYEDMLEDTASELSRIIKELTGNQPEEKLVKQVVNQHDFTRLTQRKKGVEDANAFIRKGISGDWRNYFTPEAARVFDAYAGDLLIELGYESNPDWASTQRD
jgi:hypothetical protein